jgi:hypothetical protein
MQKPQRLIHLDAIKEMEKQMIIEHNNSHCEVVNESDDE